MSSVVPVYSIAKSYTAAAALLTFEPTRTAGSVVPELPERLRQLSFEDLLSHRSGLDDYFTWPAYRTAVETGSDPWDTDRVLAGASIDGGGCFRYSNTGFLLVRLALEAAHGCDFHEVLDELLFRPLGVSAHRFSNREDWGRCDHPAITASLRGYHPGWVCTGTFAAEPDEAARGLALVMQGQLGTRLPRQMQQSRPVSAPHDHPMAPHAGYALGLMTRGTPPTVVGHGGQGPGFSVFAAVAADGSRWRGEATPQRGEDLQLIRRCVDHVIS